MKIKTSRINSKIEELKDDRRSEKKNRFQKRIKKEEYLQTLTYIKSIKGD